MDPQQEMFTALKLAIEALPYDCYDGALPPEGTPYPFVYYADTELTDMEIKGGAFGTVTQTVHVWHNDPDERGTVSEMLMAIKMAARRIEKTKTYGWQIRNIHQSILADDTTATPLVHGVLTITYQFS